MLSRTDFLSLVLPPTGNYCVMGLKGKDKPPKQIFVSSVEEINNYADAFVHRGYDAYFALASFTDDSGRTNANAEQLNSFFVDLDCGLGKPYADQSAGLVALKEFIKKTELPKPTVIVNSGRGVHAYWVVEQPLPKAEWKTLAEGLKALCTAQNLHADPAVTADVARILRIPDTLNFKDIDNPQPVKILLHGPRVSVEAIREKIVSDELQIAGEPPFKRTIDPTTLALMGNYQSRFKTILIKSIQDEGCAQIKYIYENQEEVEEPLWRAGLSIAQQCVDGEKGIHILSNKHPGYDKATTIRKAAQTKGPYTCETFKKLAPRACEDCKLKITSPIQIGREVIEPDDSPKTVEALEPVTEEIRTYQIPAYPFPFFRGHVGGIFRRANKDEENDKDELLFPYDFYVVKRLYDPEDGECVMMRLHLPKDGVREFIMPLREVISKEKFTGKIAEYGIAVLGKKQEKLMHYTTRWVEELQAIGKAEVARKQFGWLSDDSAFILGDKEIRHDTVEYSPPSSATLPLVPAFGARGDFHDWKNIINHYATPGLEMRAFAFFMGFGGPLLKFIGGGFLNGFLLNLISPNGGTGKSTLLHAINSIYGNPQALMMTYKDTHNFRLHRFGVLQNVTATIDELTNMKADMMSDVVYDITSGVGKGRMSGKANVERINNTTWKLPAVSSSNKAIRDILLTVKGFPEPELLRILEADLVNDLSMDAIQAKRHFGKLSSHYGHAITPYLQYTMTHLPEIMVNMEKLMERIDRAANITGNERYWSAALAAGIGGGIISKKLGLHDIPTAPVFDFAIELVKENRRKNKDSLFSADDFIGTFCQQHREGMLIVNANKDKRTGIEMGAIREPRGALIMRYEPDTGLLFISTRFFREYCNKLHMNFEAVLEPYKKNKSFIDQRRKRMFAGTSADVALNVMCLCFDTNRLESFVENKEALLNAPPFESLDPY